MTNFAYSGIESGLDSNRQDRPTRSWWQRQSIRFKTTVLAIAIGTIPTLIVGSVVYYFAADAVIRESSNLRQALVGELQNQLDIFMSDRLGDVRVMANLPLFTNPRLNREATRQEKSAALQEIQDAYGFYNSIAVFDLQGNVIAQTKGKSLDNHLNRSYVRDALQANRPIISQPLISTSTGVFSIYAASPIKDTTGKTIGFVRARIPMAALSKLLQNYTQDNSQYYLLDDRGRIFLGSAGEYVVKTKSDGSTAADSYDYKTSNITDIFADASSLLSSVRVATTTTNNTQTQTEQFLAYTPLKNVAGLTQLDWQAVLATDSAVVYAPQRRLMLIFALGSSVVALGVGAIAYSLANRLLGPIFLAANAIQEIGEGHFSTQLEIEGGDEIARLGGDINRLATQMKNFVKIQTILTQQSQSIKNIALQLAQANNIQDIFEIAIRGSYRGFDAERVVYFEFDSESAVAVAECVAPGHPTIKSTQLDAAVVAEYLALERLPTVETIDNVARSSISTAKQRYLNSLGVKACSIAPVTVNERLNGLLMVHQSSAPSPWLDESVEFLTQVANQIGMAIARLDLMEQQRVAEFREKSAKEAMQSRALSLLQEVDDVSTGDLTIRARVTEDEIGTIADSYNSTIESLQRLVEQTKAAATEVQLNTSTNDEAVRSLAEDTIAQATVITDILHQIEEMETSIESIAERASQAEEFVRQASSTIAREDLAMNRTVAEIKTVQHTVAQTATKAEKLGESSQEIFQAVNLIGRFAAQTHLLALKASIEAARAGEQGKGFAVIADEVRSLATQSAEATAEIETLVSKIQLETTEVVEAMHEGAAQIASGNELVQQTRQSLTQISQVSSEISKLVSSITLATQQQSATSARVSQSMVGVKATAEHNSQSATKLSSSIRDLAAIANNLQSNIAKFKT